MITAIDSSNNRRRSSSVYRNALKFLVSRHDKRRANSECVIVENTPKPRRLQQCASLGSGLVLIDGSVSFCLSPVDSVTGTESASSFASSDEEHDTFQFSPSEASSLSCKASSVKSVLSTLKETTSSIKAHLPSVAPILFSRSSSTFMRTSDLGLLESMHSISDAADDEEVHPHFHHPSKDAPPGVDHDPKEIWVALDNGVGHFAPIAPVAVEALTTIGIKSAMNKNMWTPDRRTEKVLRGRCEESMWEVKGPIALTGTADESDVLVWSGIFDHGGYGSDIPSVRAEALINMAPKALFELLMDSSRVSEYNKTSLGRQDLLVLQNDLHVDGPFGKSITKIVKSCNKPPLVRKTLEFVTLIHAQELVCGSGFLIVSRAVTRAEEAGAKLDGSILRSEILMGVNVIRRVQGDANKCVMINVNHLRSPMIPMMIAKRIGLSAASNFITDIRSIC